MITPTQWEDTEGFVLDLAIHFGPLNPIDRPLLNGLMQYLRSFDRPSNLDRMAVDLIDTIGHFAGGKL